MAKPAPTGADLLRRLHAHRMWSNARLLDAVRTLSDEQLDREFPIGMGSIRKTLVHLYGAEYVWLQAIEGEPRPGSVFEITFDSMDALATAWAGLDDRWLRFLETLDDAQLTRPVAKSSSRDPAGPLTEIALHDILLHLCDHAAYTSAQAVNMLRHTGVEPLPDRMLATMARQTG